MSKGSIFVTLAVAVAAAIVPGCGVPDRGMARPAVIDAHDTDADAAVRTLVDDYVRTGKVSGIVIAIGRGDDPGEFFEAGRIGDEPGAPEAGPDSLWRIYSMTKPITAMAAMALIEDGKLKLDQPIGDFIPAFRSMRVLVDPAKSLESRPAAGPITVRHLLTHSSGLIYQFIGKGPLQAEYLRLGLIGGRADPKTRLTQPRTLAEFADRAASLPLVADPGSEWHYSISADVLGRVVEVASGMPFERYVQTRLLDPMGMKSTYWVVPAAQAGRLATVYAWVDDKKVPIDAGATSDWLRPPEVHYGGSGLVSSARDYDRFLQMLAGGGRIGAVRVLKAQTVRLAMSNLLPPGVQVVAEGTPDTTAAQGFGAGGWVYLNDVPGGVHAGTYGWFGAAGTIAFIDPARRLRVTVMVNYFPGNKWPLHKDILGALYADK